MKQTLVFVYNADGGVFNVLTDIAHKVFSPQTYSCNLCAHSNLGMRKEWKPFIESLDRQVEFLHGDELRARYRLEGLRLPVMLEKKDGELKTLIDAESINACQNLGELKPTLVNKLS